VGGVDDVLIGLVLDPDSDLISIEDFDREVKKLREKWMQGELK
jgi:hypothetical protein